MNTPLESIPFFHFHAHHATNQEDAINLEREKFTPRAGIKDADSPDRSQSAICSIMLYTPPPWAIYHRPPTSECCGVDPDSSDTVSGGATSSSCTGCEPCVVWGGSSATLGC